MTALVIDGELKEISVQYKGVEGCTEERSRVAGVSREASHGVVDRATEEPRCHRTEKRCGAAEGGGEYLDAREVHSIGVETGRMTRYSGVRT